MVAVVHENIQDRNDRVELAALDAAALQLFDKGARDKADAAHIIVKNADLDTVGGALGKDVLQLLPGGGVLDGVVLHKNKMLGAAQCLLLCLQRGAGVAVEGYIGIVIGRVACPRLQVVGVVARGAVGVGQRPALGQQGRVVAAQQR